MAESIDPEITAHVADLAGAARRASRRLGLLSRAEKDAALLVVGVGPAYPAARPNRITHARPFVAYLQQ